MALYFLQLELSRLSTEKCRGMFCTALLKDFAIIIHNKIRENSFPKTNTVI